MNRKSITAILVIVVLVLCTSANAFDGERKGFALGIGFGFSPYIYTSNNTLDFNQSNPGFGLNLFVGWNIDNKNLITAEINAATPVDYEDNYTGNQDNSARGAYRGFNWYHYYKSKHPSWFTVAGLGNYISFLEYRSVGFGLLIGGGYEFAKQVQVGAYYYQGYPNDGPYEYTGRTLIILVTAVMY